MKHKTSEELWTLLEPVLEEYTVFLVRDREKRVQILESAEKAVKEDTSVRTADETAGWIKRVYWQVFDAYMGTGTADKEEKKHQGKEYIEDDFDRLIRNAIKRMDKKRSFRTS